MKYYLGLATTFHDPALAIVDAAGEVLFAEAAERYFQTKRARGCAADHRFWIESLLTRYTDPKAPFVVAKSWSATHRRILNVMHVLGLLNHEKISGRSDRLTEFCITVHELLSVSSLQLSCQMQAGGHFIDVLRSKFNNTAVRYVNYPHHLAHAAAACFASPFAEAACMIIDGQGEGGSITYYHYTGGKLRLVQRVRGAASLGILYMMVTKFCGFDPDKGEEWKVMGLAPYGKLDEPLYREFKALVNVRGGAIRYAGMKQLHACLAAMQTRMRGSDDSPLRVADMAYTGQYFYSETMTQLLAHFHSRRLSDNLVLGGGCGLNSSYNGRIVEQTPFKSVFVPSAPADDGTAIGAAWLAQRADHPAPTRPPAVLSPYLGSSLNRETIERIREYGGLSRLRHLPGAIWEATAALLAAGRLVGWVQGRSEFGPRALGNRSILADPRPPTMQERINATVKFREEFRPFAPSILHEYGDQYFERYQESPYMERALRFRPEMVGRVPAVVHVDGTGRLQTVKAEWNERFYRLLRAFHALTGVPVLLNTSFNIMGKPIIHSVEDALGVFFTTGLEVLVIDDYLIEK